MELSKNVQQIIDLVKEMKAVELNSLVKAIEEEFWVTAAAVAVAGWTGWAGWADADGGSDEVNVELTEIGQQKISVIKVVKEVLWVGLKEAKELVEKAPVIVKEKLKADDADALKTKLEEAGATVNLK